jgi:hypothetical protein
MENLEDVSAEDLRQILAEVDDADAAQRLMAAITYKEINKLTQDEAADRHGVKIADSTVSMNFLSLLFGVSTVEDRKTEFADELPDEDIDGLVGVADEIYPAKKGAKQHLYEENMRRKQSGEQSKKWPKAFTVGSSYLPQIGCFAGLQ